MDDSSFFMQWAMDTLHQLPSDATGAAAEAYATDVGGDSGGAAFPSLQALRNASAAGGGGGFRDLTVQVDQVHRASSWSSSDSPGGAATATGWSTHVTSGGRGHRPMSWNFSAASAQPTTEDSGGGGGGGGVPAPQAMETATARVAVGAGKKGGGGSSGSAAAAAPGYVQDHIIAERRRREKINQRFIELSTVIPGLKKMDKATILGDAVKYVKELQEKVKTMEEDGGGGGRAAMVVRKSCSRQSGDGGEGSTATSRVPEIEARLSERSVLVRVHCGNARGLLVRLLSEVEELRLGITHTSVMPFPASTVIITITAKASYIALLIYMCIKLP
uniref:BHLH domain-containing protein n=1 Tax=Oryza punctata TaxID=4537 RepID=A0A0E0MPX5_ORYPU